MKEVLSMCLALMLAVVSFVRPPAYASQTETRADISSQDLEDRIIDSIRNNEQEVDVSDLNVYIDLSNGCHILTDFEDDLFYEYAEDSFCVSNLTFRQEGGKLMSVKINYTDDFQTIAAMRQELSARIDEIVAEAEVVEDETEKIGKVSELIWRNYCDDFSQAVEVRGSDAYGCLVNGFANRYGAACAFQACMKRLGYEGGYYAPAEIYCKTKISDEWKYTAISLNQSRQRNAYLLTTMKESKRNYQKEALKTAEYTPISMFSYNPYLSEYSENARYFAEKVVLGAETITLPEPIYYNYKCGYNFLHWRHEYPEVGFLLKGSSMMGGVNIANNIFTLTPNYIDKDKAERDRMVEEYHEKVEKIVRLAETFESDEDKIIFANNYIRKMAVYEEYIDGVYLEHSHDAYGCLVENLCVCEGFAVSFHDVMKRLGIQDTFVQSYNHIWNKVNLDGQIRHVDVTNGNRYLLADNHDPNDWHNNAKDCSIYIYSLNDTLSMKSSATLQIVQAIGNGETYVDTSDMDFRLDASQSRTTDQSWYFKNLQNVYPVEMRDVASMEFILDGDDITALKISYTERTEEEVEAFNAVIREILNKASTMTTEADVVSSCISSVRSLGIKQDSTNDDWLRCAIDKKSSYLVTARLCGYALEKLGIRYHIIMDQNNYPYIKTVYDGIAKYSCIQMGLKNQDAISSYKKANYYPVYDFRNEEAENEYMDGSQLVSATQDSCSEHSFDEGTVVQEPDCENVGYIQYRCRECGTTYREEIPVSDHDWGEWTVVKEPTRTEEGVERRVCSHSSEHYEERAIPSITPPSLWGDVDMNEKIELADAIHVLRYINGKTTGVLSVKDEFTQTRLWAADANEDEVVDSEDLTQIYRYLLGRPSLLSIA